MLYGPSRIVQCLGCPAMMLNPRGQYCFACAEKRVNTKPFPAEWAASHRDPLPSTIRHESFGLLGNVVGWCVVMAIGIAVDLGDRFERARKAWRKR